MVQARPPRPFGLSLAIILTVTMFSVLPLLQIGVNWYIQQRIAQINEAEVDFLPDDDQGGVQPLAVGGSYESVSTTQILLQGALSLFFLVVAIMAWRGRPPWVRFLLFGGIVILTLFSGTLLILEMLKPASIEAGITSADVFFTQARCIQLFFTIVVPLYSVWYMNRAPARAFYRGTYLEGEMPDQPAQGETSGGR